MTEDILRRVPPQNLEAEQSVLGSVLLENEAINDALEVLNPDDFYRESHREIFRVMTELSDRIQPVDAITMTDALRTRGKLEAIGGPAYIAELAQCVPTAAHVAHYARIVREKAVLRDLASTATEIASSAYDNPHDVSGFVDNAEQQILAIRRTNTGAACPVSETIGGMLVDLHAGLNGQGPKDVRLTGFRRLDQLTGGLGPTDMMLVAARPSIGKTSFITTIIDHIASTGAGVMFFSAEMSQRDISARLVCAAAQVDLLAYRQAERGFTKLSQVALDGIHREAERIGALNIFVDERPGNIGVISAKARRLARKVQLGAICVDYLQLLDAQDRRANRERQVAEISAGLKQLAKELRVPVIAAAQLNRQSANRPDHRPQLSDLRESGSLENDADVVLLLHRPIVYARQAGVTTEVDSTAAEVLIAKQRNGPTALLPMTFREEYAKFEDASSR